MDDPRNLRDDLSRAHWCCHFSCSKRELMEAVRVTHSINVGTVGQYLATRFDAHVQEESE